MPVYEVRGPDGKKFRVTSKEGQTQQDANRYIFSKYYGDKPVDVAKVSNLATQVPALPAEKPKQERSYVPAPSFAKKALQPVTTYPAAVQRTAAENYAFAQEGVAQLQEPGFMPKVKGVGKIGLGLLGVATTPVEAAIETVAGKPIEEAVGIPSESTELVLGMALPFGSKTKAVRKAAKEVQEKTGIDVLETTAAGQAEKAARERVIKSTQTPLPVEQVRGGIASKPIQVYQDYVGRPALEFMKQSPLAATTAATASVLNVERLPEDATVEDKMKAMALGALGGFGAAKVVKGTVGRIPTPTSSDENLANFFSRMTIDNYGLPADYLEVKQNAKIFKNQMSSDFLDLTRDVAKLSDDERRTMYYMMQGEAVPVENLANLSEKARDTITKYGQKMVDVGLLSPETFEKNAATYLRREYASKLKPEGLFNRAANTLRVIGSSLKPRGVIMEISKNNLSKYEADGWERFGDAKGNKIKVRRQLTPEERRAKGEIDDAAYAIARTGQLMTNDIATYKMYDDIAKMDQYVSDAPVEGWIQLSTDKIPKTNVTRYGNLAGKYVSPEVAKDLQGLEFARGLNRNPLFRTYRDALAAWKVGKTAFNPAVHMNNVVSNVMLYDLSGSNWTSLASAANELRKGDKSDLYNQAQRLGVFDAGFSAQELGREGKQVLDAIEKSRPADNVVDSALKIANAGWQKTGGKVVDAYQGEDSIFRFGIFLDRIKAGMSPEDAAKESKKWLIDYEINAPLIQGLRNTTHPFIAYSYRAIPLLAESAVLRPWKYAKWAALGYAVNEYGESESPGRDIEAERRMMPEYQKGTMFGIPGAPPTMIKLPSEEPKPDEKGDVSPSMYLDVQKFIPGGDVFATTEAAGRKFELLPQFLQPGGPIFDFITIFQEGRDPFTGRDLPGLNIGATEGEIRENNIAVKSSRFITSLLPNLPGIPGMPATEKFAKAEAGAESLTQPKITVAQAALQTFGIKVAPIDVEKLTMQQLFSMDREIQTISKDYQSKLSKHQQGLMDDAELAKHSEAFNNRLESIFSKYEKRIKGPEKEEDKKPEAEEPKAAEPKAEEEKVEKKVIRFVGPDGRPYNVKAKPGQTEADVEKYILKKYYGVGGESEKPEEKSYDLDKIISERGASELAPLIRSIYQQESSSGRAAGLKQENYAGAKGPMQVTRDTFETAKRAGLIPEDYSFDNQAHLAEAGVALIQDYNRRYGGDPAKIAAAYYGGPGAVTDKGILRNRRDPRNPKAPTVGQYADEVLARLMPTAEAKGFNEGGLVAPGNIDVSKLPAVRNPDGTVSTVRSMSVNINGKEVLIPTVINGRVVSDEEAIQSYLKTGRHLGMFSSPEAATAYGKSLSAQEAQRVKKSRGGYTLQEELLLKRYVNR
jgi:hypothetical protein